MQLRLFKIIGIIIPLLFGLYCTGKSQLHKNPPNESRKLRFISKSVNNTPNHPFNYELILSRAPAPIINVPQTRNIYFSCGLNNRLSTYTIFVNYLNFICGRGNSELSHFRRLILFPFHDFW